MPDFKSHLCCFSSKQREGDIYISKEVRPAKKNSAGTRKPSLGGGDERKSSVTKFHRLDRSAEFTSLEIEDDDQGQCVGYARILKTPQKERRIRLRPVDIDVAEEPQQSSNSDERSSVPGESSTTADGQSSDSSTQMIATLSPLKQSNGQQNNAPNGSAGGKLRIEDVTDDPRYKDADEEAEFEEGALVEYCHSKVLKPSAVLKQPPLVVRRPSSAVRTANQLDGPIRGGAADPKRRNGTATATTPSAASNGANSRMGAKPPTEQHERRNGRSTTANTTAVRGMAAPNRLVSSSGGGSRWRSSSTSAAKGQRSPFGTSSADGARIPQMAHVIDVEVGQPCSRMAQCNCYGFRPHQWRKVCVHCKCDRSEHELGNNQAVSVYERLGIKPSSEMAKVLQQRKQSGQQNNNAAGGNDVAAIGSVGHGYAWVPPGISRIKVEEYMSQLPNHMVPRLNSIGEKNREKQLMIQLPRQDLSIAYCKHLKTPQERRLYEEFVNARNEVALDIGFVHTNVAKAMECRKCRGVIERNELAVVAPKLGESTGWHAACFNCSTCEQLLVDLTYCVRDEKVYCERHFAELHKPRCSACDELIFAGEYTKAMNKDWHSDHFCCWQCDSQLTGQRYILRDDHPYCIKCYEEIFANVCDECQKHIGIDSKDLSYKDKHWHEDCFLCSMCKVSLVDKPFGSKNDRIFCSNCYDQAFATRCDGCGEIFKAGMKKMEYKGKQWHDKCFCCAQCKSPIGTRSFIPKNEEVYCAACYEEKFATRCCKCKKVISTGGVTYKNEPWHRECFCCTNCNTSLAGQRFTSKDEKPYCADCYGELFAKRCSACVKPITGIGGAKFISFEDRHWHNDCFLCGQCTVSLVGKGFITDGADILCADCAKARLMAANS